MDFADEGRKMCIKVLEKNKQVTLVIRTFSQTSVSKVKNEPSSSTQQICFTTFGNKLCQMYLSANKCWNVSIMTKLRQRLGRVIAVLGNTSLISILLHRHVYHRFCGFYRFSPNKEQNSTGRKRMQGTYFVAALQH